MPQREDKGKYYRMDGIRYWIETEGTGHWFFVAFPVCLLALFIWFKGRRVTFLIPSLLMSIVIINPWFYKAWEKLGLYAYWRILWIVPVIPVIAALIPCISERIQWSWMKAVVAAVGVGLIVFGGTFLYNGTGGTFVEAANAAKLPDYVVQIADRLLELDDHPRVITQDPVGVYIRQFSGKIMTLYGRDILGSYISTPNDNAKKVNAILNDPHSNKAEVAQLMANEGYDYLIYSGSLDQNFKHVNNVGNYNIYKTLVSPSKIKERNDMGQITTVSTVNEHGKLINNEISYSTIHVRHDTYNNLIAEWRTNAEGRIVEYPTGHAFMEQEWENADELKLRRYLDTDRNLTQRMDGYSRVEWIVNSEGVRSIHLYNASGEEISIEGLNLAVFEEGASEEWSDWITPQYDISNSTFTIGKVILGDKTAGDVYSCQIEIEFQGVAATEGRRFLFRTQGAQDGSWEAGNVWNNKIVDITEPVEDGLYRYGASTRITEEMASISSFDVGFRCDNWASGAFRVVLQVNGRRAYRQ